MDSVRMSNFWKKYPTWKHHTWNSCPLATHITKVIKIWNLRKKHSTRKIITFIASAIKVADSVCYLNNGCYKNENFEEKKPSKQEFF
jgi:hypothetical protein